MRKQYSFLSPENINFLIMELRGIYPENVHSEIRENLVYMARDWFLETGPTVEEQFTQGTKALNSAFINYLIMSGAFMPPPHDNLPSYFTDNADPHILNQPFQNVVNKNFYESQKMDYNFRKNAQLKGIYNELDEIDIGGVPIKGNLLESQISYIVTEVSRNRDRLPKSHRLTWGVKRQCNDNFTSCEHPALPRRKFTLPRDYYTSAPASAYWMGVEPCSSEMKKYTEWSAGGLAGRNPSDDNCANPRMSHLYAENVYKYPNYEAYRKDYIPSIMRNKRSM